MALFGRGTPTRSDDLRKGTPRDPRQFMATAEEFRRAGRIRECIETLDRGVRENPGYVAAHVALGRAYLQGELVPRAIQAFQDALKIDRENLVAVRQLAECYLRQGDKLEALKKLKLFRGLNPGEKGVSEQIQQLEAALEAERRAAAEARKEGSGAFSRGARVTRTGPIPPLPPLDLTPRPPAPSSLSRETLPGLTVPPPPVPLVAATPPAPPPAPPRAAGAASSAVAPAAHAPDFDVLFAATEPPPLPAFESFLDAAPPGPPRDSAEPPTPSAVSPGEALLAEEPPLAFVPPAPEPFGEVPVAPPMPRQASVWEEETREAPPVREPELEMEPEREQELRHERPPEPRRLEEQGSERWREPRSKPEAGAASTGAAESEPPQAAAPSTATPAGVPSEPAAVSATLAEIYRSQGHLEEAARTYESLASAAPDTEAARSMREKAEALERESRATPAGRLRAWARRLPDAPRTRIEEMGDVIQSLKSRAPGVKAAVLTDLEGLPVVGCGESNEPASEALIAELTAFWKSVQRIEDEVGTGPLALVSLKGEAGAAVVTAVSAEYSLILRVERDVPLGRIRYEAARAAGLLRPALG